MIENNLRGYSGLAGRFHGEVCEFFKKTKRRMFMKLDGCIYSSSDYAYQFLQIVATNTMEIGLSEVELLETFFFVIAIVRIAKEFKYIGIVW